MNLNDLLEAIKSLLGMGGQVKGVQASTTTPTPTPTPSQRDNMVQAIQAGFSNWGNPPAATLAGTMADEAMKYPGVYKDENRFMIPAITILETGGGANMTKRPDVSEEDRQYNMTNWGINLPPGYYTPSSPENVIERTTSGIGARTPAYQKFRETGDLEDFARSYAPESDNPGTGGSNYVKNIKSVMDVFNKEYDKRK